MAKIVINKKVKLDFLGDGHENSYIDFKSMPISRYEKLLDEVDGLSPKESLEYTVKVLEEHFTGGKFGDEDITKDNLRDFDLDSLTRILEVFTGQNPDPKV